MGMTLTLGVGCTGMNRCDPLQASTLTLGVARALAFGVKKKLCEFMFSRRVAAELTFGGRKAIHNEVKQTHVNVNLQLLLL